MKTDHLAQNHESWQSIEYPLKDWAEFWDDGTVD
jgi:hypothetical protein